MFEIENNIPIPKKTRGSNAKYKFVDMEIGDSFFVEGTVKVQISILTCARRHLPKKFVTKSVVLKGKKGFRCWRTK